MKWIISIVILTSAFFASAQSGNDYVKLMYKKYAGNWYHNLSFSQTTKVYRNDSLIRTSLWLEWIKFPFQFRIDTDTASKSGIICTRDSTYRFKEGKLTRATAGGNPFTFSLGGMYFMPLDSVLAEFGRTGYDLSKAYKTNYKGRPTYVVGASSGDGPGNTMWVDAENLYVVRTVESENGRRIDAQMAGHKKLGNGWSETLVNIYGDGKLIQVEEYKDLRANTELRDNLFDIGSF
jgi:hypothetical protein